MCCLLNLCSDSFSVSYTTCNAYMTRTYSDLIFICCLSSYTKYFIDLFVSVTICVYSSCIIFCFIFLLRWSSTPGLLEALSCDHGLHCCSDELLMWGQQQSTNQLGVRQGCMNIYLASIGQGCISRSISLLWPRGFQTAQLRLLQ